MIISALVLPLGSKFIGGVFDTGSASGSLDELGLVDEKVDGGISLDDLEEPATVGLEVLFRLIGERAAKNSR